eukprot:352291-Chlamydomonas_euryale.AAC.5
MSSGLYRWLPVGTRTKPRMQPPRALPRPLPHRYVKAFRGVGTIVDVDGAVNSAGPDSIEIPVEAHGGLLLNKKRVPLFY